MMNSSPEKPTDLGAVELSGDEGNLKEEVARE